MKEFDSETGSNFDLCLASQWTADIHFHILKKVYKEIDGWRYFTITLGFLVYV